MRNPSYSLLLVVLIAVWLSPPALSKQTPPGFSYDTDLVWKFAEEQWNSPILHNGSYWHSNTSMSGVIEVDTGHMKTKTLVFHVVAYENPSIGQVSYSEEGRSGSSIFTWDLTLDSPSISLSSDGEKTRYTLTPVSLPSSNFGSKQSTYAQLESMFPGAGEMLTQVLSSKPVSNILPATIVNNLNIGNDKLSSRSMDAASPGAQGTVGNWLCSLECGSVLGAGLLTVVSGGTLGPGLVAGAAACGSCMGFVWGQSPVNQPPVLLPGGGGGSVGSILPPLPPGWVWSCTPISGGYSCVPVGPDDHLDPYYAQPTSRNLIHE